MYIKLYVHKAIVLQYVPLPCEIALLTSHAWCSVLKLAPRKSSHGYWMLAHCRYRYIELVRSPAECRLDRSNGSSPSPIAMRHGRKVINQVAVAAAGVHRSLRGRNNVRRWERSERFQTRDETISKCFLNRRLIRGHLTHFPHSVFEFYCHRSIAPFRVWYLQS